MLRIILVLICFANIVQVVANDSADQSLKLTDQGYLHSSNVSVLAYHNHYSVGKLGGIELIHHDQRVATNGMLKYKFKEAVGDSIIPQPIPVVDKPERVLDRSRGIITVPFEFESGSFGYQIEVVPLDKGAFNLIINFDRPVSGSEFDTIAFSMDFFPGMFKGKSFQTEKDFGVLPYNFCDLLIDAGSANKAKPLATGHRLNLAVEDPLQQLQVTSNVGRLYLTDSRYGEDNQWFTMTVEVPTGVAAKAVDLVFEPSYVEGWKRSAVISYSQVGYHPNQTKVAYLELLSHQTPEGSIELIKLDNQGAIGTLIKSAASLWGDYLRYKYYAIDFTEVATPGLYQLRYQDKVTAPFRIAEDIYKERVWQPVLNTFLPVQMCHMRIKDRNKLWHGACHLDDASQAPAPMPFFDGFRQNERLESRFEPLETVTGLNTGGWHDAADDDINTGSTGRATYHLALMIEEFGLTHDQTTIDFTKRRVELHRPDGIPDALQQLKQGLSWLMAMYDVSDHSYVGVISRDWQTYLQSGGWGEMTDNLFYNPTFPSDSTNGIESGVADDRYAFTNKDSRREYLVASIMAASSRALALTDDSMSSAVLQLARDIVDREEASDPVLFDNVATPKNLQEQRINAFVELYLATQEARYLDLITQSLDEIRDNFEWVAWTLSRVKDKIKDKSFIKLYEQEIVKYAQNLKEQLSENPFGVILPHQVWGFNWEILWSTYSKYYLIKSDPKLFPADYLYDAIHYTMGRHPISNISHVSGVGAHRPIPAYGLNRSDFSYIPGGVFSGVEIIEPDFFELKDNHPFLWQQSEYIVYGATPFMFCALAADRLLNQDE